MDDKKQQAISQFESGDYRGAFLSFKELYENSSNEEEREIILHLLRDAYYQPNEDELTNNYLENCALLKSYPFQIGYQTCAVDTPPIQ